MAIYNLGQLQRPQQQVNPIGDALAAFNASLSERRELRTREKMSTQDRSTQLQIAAAKAKQEQDEKRKEHYEMNMDLAIDRLGRKEFARLIDSDKAYGDIYKGYLEFNPELKDLPVDSVLGAKTTRKEVEEKYMQQAERIKVAIDANKPMSATELGNATYILETAKKQRLISKEAYVTAMKKIAEIQMAMVEGGRGYTDALVGGTPPSSLITPAKPTRFKVTPMGK